MPKVTLEQSRTGVERKLKWYNTCVIYLMLFKKINQKEKKENEVNSFSKSTKRRREREVGMKKWSYKNKTSKYLERREKKNKICKKNWNKNLTILRVSN